MKIAAIFIDMISADKLNLCNSGAEWTMIDECLQRIGGTLYANCYTPAPDTPRASGCMWTGVYPKANGCDLRYKYPREFLSSSKTNFWSVLKQLNYKINIFMRKSAVAIGMLPEWAEQYVYPNGEDIEGFLKSIVSEDRTFTFIYLPDFHICLDMFKASREGVKKGEELIGNILMQIMKAGNIEEYDHVFMFSDHGFRMAGEQHRHLLERDRVQTLMLWRKKDQKTLQIDNALRSNMDLFPTICEIVGYEYDKDIDGKSLSGNGHEYILLEDHKNFKVELGQTIERWGVVYKGHIYWLDVVGWDMYDAPKDTDFAMKEFEQIISEKGTDYVENKKITDIIHKHDNDTYMHATTFSDGMPLDKLKDDSYSM